METGYSPGRLFEHTSSGAVFRAAPDTTTHGSCDGCAGSVSHKVCDVLPSGCNADRIIWHAANNQAKVLAVTLRLEE